jgi:hypothetical protein
VVKEKRVRRDPTACHHLYCVSPPSLLGSAMSKKGTVAKLRDLAVPVAIGSADHLLRSLRSGLGLLEVLVLPRPVEHGATSMLVGGQLRLDGGRQVGWQTNGWLALRENQ